ncbi:hypothetical protein [Azospirillum largimobile]
MHWAFPPPETMNGRIGAPACNEPLWLPTIQFQMIPIKHSTRPIWKRYRESYYDGKSVSRTGCGSVALRQKTG